MKSMAEMVAGATLSLALLAGSGSAAQLKVEVRVSGSGADDGTPALHRGQDLPVRVTISNPAAVLAYEKARSQQKEAAEKNAASGRGGALPAVTIDKGLAVPMRPGITNWLQYVHFQVVADGDKVDEKAWVGLDKQLPSDEGRLEDGASVGGVPLEAEWTLPQDRTKLFGSGRHRLLVRFDTRCLERPEAPNRFIEASEAFVVSDEAPDARKAAQISYESARAALRNGNYDGAIEAAKKAIASNPAHEMYQSYVVLGDAYKEKGMTKEALAAYEVFLQHNPSSDRWRMPVIVRQKVKELKQQQVPARAP